MFSSDGLRCWYNIKFVQSFFILGSKDNMVEGWRRASPGHCSPEVTYLGGVGRKSFVCFLFVFHLPSPVCPPERQQTISHSQVSCKPPEMLHCASSPCFPCLCCHFCSASAHGQVTLFIAKVYCIMEETFGPTYVDRILDL